MNIVLTGFMASGKSTVARRLSKILNRDFADTDVIIEEKSGMKIAEIFDKYGENYFRNLEKETVGEVSKKDNLIIATGGGVVLDRNNIDNLRQNGVIINLEPGEEVIKARLLDDVTRPLVKDNSLDEIMKRFNDRKPFYDNCDFKIKVSIDMDADCVCNRILELLRGRL